jgi:hypothetical protein
MPCGPFDKPLLGDARRIGACAALALAAALGGCVTTNPFNAPVDQSSPVAAHIAELPKTVGPSPKWSEFPRGPQPTPPPGEIALRVASVEEAQADLLNTATALKWTLAGTQAFAATARSEIIPEYATPAPADQAAQIEAIAKSLREQAAPPPPPPSKSQPPLKPKG